MDIELIHYKFYIAIAIENLGINAKQILNNKWTGQTFAEAIINFHDLKKMKLTTQDILPKLQQASIKSFEIITKHLSYTTIVNNKTKPGKIVFQLQHFTDEQMIFLQQCNVVCLFGENNQDQHRSWWYVHRRHNGGQAAVLGKFDRKHAYGITTTYYGRRKHPPSIDEMKNQINREFIPLKHHIKTGGDVIVPAPSKTDISRAKNKYCNQFGKQIIFHNIGTGIANLSQPLIIHIQNKIDELVSFSSGKVTKPFYDIEEDGDYKNEERKEPDDKLDDHEDAKDEEKQIVINPRATNLEKKWDLSISFDREILIFRNQKLSVVTLPSNGNCFWYGLILAYYGCHPTFNKMQAEELLLIFKRFVIEIIMDRRNFYQQFLNTMGPQNEWQFTDIDSYIKYQSKHGAHADQIMISAAQLLIEVPFIIFEHNNLQTPTYMFPPGMEHNEISQDQYYPTFLRFADGIHGNHFDIFLPQNLLGSKYKGISTDPIGVNEVKRMEQLQREDCEFSNELVALIYNLNHKYQDSNKFDVKNIDKKNNNHHYLEDVLIESKHNNRNEVRTIQGPFKIRDDTKKLWMIWIHADNVHHHTQNLFPGFKAKVSIDLSKFDLEQKLYEIATTKNPLLSDKGKTTYKIIENYSNNLQYSHMKLNTTSLRQKIKDITLGYKLTILSQCIFIQLTIIDYIPVPINHKYVSSFKVGKLDKERLFTAACAQHTPRSSDILNEWLKLMKRYEIGDDKKNLFMAIGKQTTKYLKSMAVKHGWYQVINSFQIDKDYKDTELQYKIYKKIFGVDEVRLSSKLTKPELEDLIAHHKSQRQRFSQYMAHHNVRDFDRIKKHRHHYFVRKNNIYLEFFYNLNANLVEMVNQKCIEEQKEIYNYSQGDIDWVYNEQNDLMTDVDGLDQMPPLLEADDDEDVDLYDGSATIPPSIALPDDKTDDDNEDDDLLDLSMMVDLD